MIYEYEINGVALRTGDLVATKNGSGMPVVGQFWWLVGHLIPGEVDHIAIYVGPGGRMVEAGAKGRVLAFDVPQGRWDGDAMYQKRGFVDQFLGVAYPLSRHDVGEGEDDIREAVAVYCMRQAAQGKPYNLNFFDSETEDAFYCSQLAYKAYQPHGIDLNTGMEVLDLPVSKSIIFPQEVWDGCRHTRA